MIESLERFVATEISLSRQKTLRSMSRRNSSVAPTRERSIAHGALVARAPRRLSRAQAWSVGHNRKHCRNTSPEPCRDIKCLSRHIAEQPLSRLKIFCHDLGTMGGLSRQASICHARWRSVGAKILVTCAHARLSCTLLHSCRVRWCALLRHPVSTRKPLSRSRAQGTLSRQKTQNGLESLSR